MKFDSQSDRALRCSDEMRIMASRYAQMGFTKLASWLRKNADAALKWAGKQSL